MTKNYLLNIAISGCKILKIVFIVFFVSLSFLFVHFQIDKGFYKTINIDLKNSGFQYRKIESWDNTKTQETYTLENVTTVSLVILYLQYSFVLFVLFLIVSEFQKIIQSVKKLNTFQNENIKSFRKIGNYLIIYLFISSFHFFLFEKSAITGISISFSVLGFIIFSFIMAEIFREGMNLKNENHLTI